MDTYRISNLNLEQEDINNLKRISTNMLDTFNHEQLLSIIDVMKDTYFMNELSSYLVDDNLPNVGTEEFNFLVLANKFKGNIIRKIVRDEGISDYYLRKFILKYNLSEVDKGVYIFPHKKMDSLFIFQQKYSKAVISHETSLYLQDVIDYIPQKVLMSVPEKYNISRIQEPHENRLTSHNYMDINSNNIMDKNIPINLVRNKSISPAQIEIVNSSLGLPLRVTSVARSIVDVLKSSHKAEEEVKEQAIKYYLEKFPDKIVRLKRIAKTQNVLKELEYYLSFMGRAV
ncbi:type IV toxin-antitoxin system AbiEi family antitoxin domain-containing protein [Lactococcus lactis]|uniref:type IV toxin-antitoxin system AbiEi family antitoxin domain-containing protein n=1 Tax=Lactococcus lactis TaxID=1358 RepID=UPI0028921684|nr:hypothetical protein [Lactococcus lactis]MDT2888073.1 hypothetical protein [Lactococcus lactis]MDT2930900.1 hypothetical protein [Lactococcus lactis]